MRVVTTVTAVVDPFILYCSITHLQYRRIFRELSELRGREIKAI